MCIRDSFYPLESDPTILPKRKPKEIVLFGESFPTKTWREALLIFFKQILGSDPRASALLLSNQLETFGKSNAFIPWKELRKEIHEHSNPDYKWWFKTLDNKFCEELKEIDEECLFIYVNHSRIAIIDRIARTMRLLNLDSDEVIIKL